jgi:hypothetical protein
MAAGVPFKELGGLVRQFSVVDSGIDRLGRVASGIRH